MELFPEAMEYTSDADLYNHYLFLPLTTSRDKDLIQELFSLAKKRFKQYPTFFELDAEATQAHY